MCFVSQTRNFFLVKIRKVLYFRFFFWKQLSWVFVSFSFCLLKTHFIILKTSLLWEFHLQDLQQTGGFRWFDSCSNFSLYWKRNFIACTREDVSLKWNMIFYGLFYDWMHELDKNSWMHKFMVSCGTPYSKKHIINRTQTLYSAIIKTKTSRAEKYNVIFLQSHFEYFFA